MPILESPLGLQPERRGHRFEGKCDRSCPQGHDCCIQWITIISRIRCPRRPETSACLCPPCSRKRSLLSPLNSTTKLSVRFRTAQAITVRLAVCTLPGSFLSPCTRTACNTSVRTESQSAILSGALVPLQIFAECIVGDTSPSNRELSQNPESQMERGSSLPNPAVELHRKFGGLFLMSSKIAGVNASVAMTLRRFANLFKPSWRNSIPNCRIACQFSVMG